MANDSSQNPDKSSSPSPTQALSLPRFWQELKRRKVMRVALTYAAVTWLIIQIASSTFENFGIPDWAFKFVVIILIIGFPIALIITWAFELTPDGIKTTKVAQVEGRDTPVSEAHQKKRGWLALAFAAAVPTLIFGVLALFFFIRSGEISEPTSGSKSIAVLPLESPDPANASFALGIQDNILTNLSKIKELQVKSRTSTMRYSDPDRNLILIGQELNANYLVEGSVWRVEDKVQVTIQLIESATDNHLWADDYTRDLNDQFAISSEIAKTIAKEVKAVISPEEIERIERRPTDDLEAYEIYVQGLEYQAEETNEGFKKSIERFDAALQRDSRFLLAHIAKANSFRQRMTFFEPPTEMFRPILSAATDAIALDTDSAEARSVLGMAYLQSWRWDEAWRYLSDALSRDPRIGITHLGLALYYTSLGDARRAYIALEEANNLDPLNPEIAYWGLFISLMFRDYDLGAKWAGEKILLFPDSGTVASNACFLYSLNGDHEKAVMLAEKAVSLNPDDPFFLITLSHVYSGAGRMDDARKALAEAEQSEKYNCPYERAIAYILFGEFDAAFPLLDQAVTFRSNCLMFTRQDPRLDPIRDDPRFAQLLKTVGLDDVSIQRYPR